MKDKLYQYCLRCGRKLKKEDARKLGYGPVCYRKLQENSRRVPLFNFHKK